MAKAASFRLKIGGVVGLMEKAEVSEVIVGESGGGWGGSGEGMWSRHTFSLACLEQANENGCRVSRGKNGKGGGSKDTRARGLKEGGDG